MSLRNTQVRLSGRGFDMARRLLGVTEELTLLKTSTDEKNFNLVLKLSKSWIITFNDYRGQAKVSYATTDLDFRQYINVTSHFQFGSAVFVIDPNSRDLDIVAPVMNQPFWTIRGYGSDRVWVP